jgi:hypothetical protein
VNSRAVAVADGLTGWLSLFLPFPGLSESAAAAVSENVLKSKKRKTICSKKMHNFSKCLKGRFIKSAGGG